MRYILIFLLFTLSATAQELYVNFEDVAAGTTDSAINMGVISKTNGSAVTFGWSGSAGKVSVESGGLNMGWQTPVTVGGISYTNTSFAKHLLCKSDNTVSIPQRFTWTFAASRKASYGYWITISNFTGLGSFYGAGGLETGTDYQILSIVNDSPPFFQNESLNSPYGENINVNNNLTIWVTGLWDSAQATATSRSRMYFYNATNMTLLGWSMPTDVVQNSTVNTFKYAIHDAHTKDAGTSYRLGPVILYTNGTVFPVWPGSNLQVPTNNTVTAVQAAHDAASNGDTLVLPSTNTTWTSGVTLSKNSLKVRGMASGGQGTNLTVITADGGFTAFTVSGDFNTVSNLQIKGDGVTDEADGFLNTGMHNRYSQLYLRELNVAIYAQDFGLVDTSEIDDSWRAARVIFPSGYYATYYPLAWDSTNYMVFEDCVFRWTSAKNQTGSQAFISSQVSQSWVFRHNTVVFNNASTDPAPMFDYHGDDQGSGIPTPGVALQVYKNDITVSAGSISGQKFVDVRGSRSLVYSNKVSGASFDANQGLFYREERPLDVPNYIVNNSYEWENYDGTTGTDPIPVNDDVNITAGVDYFTTALSPLVQIPYPHPMRSSGTSPTVPGTVPATIGIGRGTVRIGIP